MCQIRLLTVKTYTMDNETNYMKPFDLEKALAGAKLVTRDGQEVTGFYRVPNIIGGHPYCGNIGKSRRHYDAAGRHRNYDSLDLFLAPEAATQQTSDAPVELKAGMWVQCIKASAMVTVGRWYEIIHADSRDIILDLNDSVNGAYPRDTDHLDLANPRTDCPYDELSKPLAQPSILEEAQQLIYGAREQDYGSVTTNFTNIAKGWEVILGTSVSPEQVGLCMAWLKIARQVNKPKRDNLVDAAGYLGCVGKLEEEKI